jgi:hypothetical protein
MPPATNAQREWVERVLGISVVSALGMIGEAPGADDIAHHWMAAQQAWETASATVDGQVAALQAALSQTGDDRLRRIAKFGLSTITGDYRVRIAAALIELGRGEPAVIQKTGPKALGIINEFGSFLVSDKRIAACDRNPFGAPVTIRATLLPALQAMTAVLEGEFKS